jgi:hypothetical protein
MWAHEDSTEVTATPARIWTLFADVTGWRSWNAGIETIELHGPFAVGTRFTMQPPGQGPLLSTLIEVTPNEGFTDETVVGETRVLVSHRIVPLAAGGVKVVYTTEVTGPDADEIGPIVTADFPDVLAALKDRAERP